MKVVELNAQRAKLDKPPVNLWRLRWRIVTDSGLSVFGSWTPETRYPSISETLRDFGGRIQHVYIDGFSLYDDAKMTFLSCPGDVLAGLSFKGGMSAARGRSEVIGIEVEDIEGSKYLVLRDGTVYVEEKERSNVANDN